MVVSSRMLESGRKCDKSWTGNVTPAVRIVDVLHMNVCVCVCRVTSPGAACRDIALA